MTADPSVVDAAVRFCDDVLASPTIELLCPFESNVKWGEFFVMWRSRTVTIPIANPAGAKVLSIVIERYQNTTCFTGPSSPPKAYALRECRNAYANAY